MKDKSDIMNEIEDIIFGLTNSNIDCENRINSESIKIALESIEKCDPEILFYKMTFPLSEFLRKEFLGSKNSSNEFFLYDKYEFINSHIKKIFEDNEGMPFCADKSRTLIRGLARYFHLGEEIIFDRSGNTYHLPQKILKTHSEIIELYKSLISLYYGNSVPYVRILETMKK